jgi:hypothetical protein
MKTRYWLAPCLAVAVVAVVPSHAAKEKFVRSKPHVNVSGPLRLTAETISVALSLVAPGAQAGRGGSDLPDCSTEVDLRVVDATDPNSPPLAESTDIPLGPNETAVLQYDAGSAAPRLVHAVVVVHDLDNVKEPDCIVRGRVEIRGNADGKVTRSVPVNKVDFVTLKRG